MSLSQPHGQFDGGTSLRIALVSLCKDAWKIALAMALVLAATATVASLARPAFVAEALLLVKFGREYTYRADTGSSEVVNNAFSREEMVTSEARILTAPDVAAEAVSVLGVERLYPDLAAEADDPPAAARERLLSDLDAQSGESNIIALTFKHDDPAVAAEALNALIAAYLAKRRPLFAETRSKPLEEKLALTAERLEAAERALEEFRKSTGIVSFGAQRQLLLERESSLQRQLEESRTELAAVREQARQLSTTLAEVEPTIVTGSEVRENQALAAANQTLLSLRMREAELRDEWLGDSIPVVQVGRAIAEARRTVEQLENAPERAVRTGPNPVHDSLSTQLADITARGDAEAARSVEIANQLDQVQGQLSLLASNERRHSRFERERDWALEAHAKLVGEVEAAKVLDQLGQSDSANVRVIQAARPPIEPRDSRTLILIAGVAASLLVGLMTAFLCDLLRGGFLVPEQLERVTGLPVLASVPFERGGMKAGLAG